MKKSILKLFVAVPAMFAVTAHAQLVNCNVFLQGNYVEVGVNWNGAFGTSTPAPAGYHAYVPGASDLYNSAACGDSACGDSTRLGFVADPDKDGWSVGSPAFYGDYFVPGDPQEGWSIMADGKQANAWNQDDSYAPGTTPTTLSVTDSITFSLVYDSSTAAYDTLWFPVYSNDTPATVPGGNISYTNAGGVATGIWQGMFDSIAIQQVTTLDSGDLYFTVQVTLTNLASTARNNVYYLRTVDPDNEEPQTGSYITRNVIKSVLPNASNLSEVSAAGVTYPDAYLAMGTNDTRGKAFFNGPTGGGLVPSYGTLDQIYAGDTTHYEYALNDSLTQDIGIGLVFNIGHLSSVDSTGAVDSAGRTSSSAVPPNRAVINFYYAFKNPNTPLGVANVTKPTIAVYPNPAKSELNITNLDMTDHIRLFDLMGRVVTSSWSIAHNGTNTFSMGDIAPGMYILQVTDKDGNARSKTPLQKL